MPSSGTKKKFDRSSHFATSNYHKHHRLKTRKPYCGFHLTYVSEIRSHSAFYTRLGKILIFLNGILNITDSTHCVLQENVVHWLPNSNIEGAVYQHKNKVISSNSDKNKPKISVTVLIKTNSMNLPF